MDDEARQAVVDAEHLKLLRWGYFVSAAMTGLFSTMGLFYAGMGFVFMRMPFKEGNAPPPELAWVFVAAGFVVMGVMVGLTVAKLFVAKALRERKSRTLCYVVAVVTLFGMPYGTLLGVLTLLVLSRPSVAAMFARSAEGDVSALAGTWAEDTAVDEALEAQRGIDEETWR